MKKIFILLLNALLTASIAYGQDYRNKLEQVMQDYHQFNMFDGAVLVAQEGKVIYKGAFGMANREWNIPNSTDTKFMIGSISKPLTAILMLIQVEKGLIDLNKPVSAYLPEFLGKPAGNVTISQLLSHTSGIPNYDIMKDFFPRISRQQFKREEYVKLYADSALIFEPGSKYYYSSWGYFTLGYIMERVTGKSYSQLMKEDLFDKIGMTSSGSYYHTQVVPKRATGYDYNLGGYSSSDFRDQTNTMGTGDIYSTVEDLFKLHQAIADHSLISPELTAAMLKPGIPPANYGYGWFNKNFKLTTSDSVVSNFHLGMTEGFLSFILRIPDKNRLIVILCNSSPTDFFGIAGSLAKVIYDMPVQVKAPVHKEMERIIIAENAMAAVNAYQRMKLDTANYYIDWISMDFLSNQLLNLKRLEDARIVTDNNSVEFPNKDLVMVTSGNIYNALGMTKEAIKFYEKALKLNPLYEEAKNRLKELSKK